MSCFSGDRGQFTRGRPPFLLTQVNLGGKPASIFNGMKPTVLYPLDYEITLARLISVRLKASGAETEALKHALQRLHAADFGACRGCGELIPFAEIESNPAAERCTACSKGER
jgi:hypothetical protein